MLPTHRNKYCWCRMNGIQFNINKEIIEMSKISKSFFKGFQFSTFKDRHLNKDFVIDIQILVFFLQIFFSDRKGQLPGRHRQQDPQNIEAFPRNLVKSLHFRQVLIHGWNQCNSIHGDSFKSSEIQSVMSGCKTNKT